MGWGELWSWEFGKFENEKILCVFRRKMNLDLIYVLEYVNYRLRDGVLLFFLFYLMFFYKLVVREIKE